MVTTRTTPDDRTADWPVVLRATGVVAVLTTALAWALLRFTPVGETVVVLGALGLALVAGSRLPAAAPWYLRPVPLEVPDRPR